MSTYLGTGMNLTPRGLEQAPHTRLLLSQSSYSDPHVRSSVCFLPLVEKKRRTGLGGATLPNCRASRALLAFSVYRSVPLFVYQAAREAFLLGPMALP